MADLQRGSSHPGDSLADLRGRGGGGCGSAMTAAMRAAPRSGSGGAAWIERAWPAGPRSRLRQWA